MRALYFFVTLGLLPACLGLSAQAGSGRAVAAGALEVVDGDTLVVDGQRVRLFGIDAPETGQYCATKRHKPFDCGRVATRTLRLFLSGAKVHCKARGQAPDGTALAECFAGRNDLAAQMVLGGWALADPATGAAYRRSELAARATKRAPLRTGFCKIRR